MASANYNAGIKGIQDRTIDYASDTIKVMLVTSSYTFNQDETSMTTASSAEPNITGYTAGFGSASRRTLASKTITNDTTNNRSVFDAADPATWTALGAGATLSAAIVYKHITDNATSVPITYLDFTDTATNGGDFSVAYDAGGIFYIQN